MSPEDSLFAHVHCLECGREMRPWGICGFCGGRGPESLSALVAARRRRAASFVTDLDGGGTPTGSPEPAPVLVAAPATEEMPTRPVEIPAPAAPDPEGSREEVPASKPPRRARRRFRPIDLWRRYLPPVRLVWIFLGTLVYLGGGFLSGRQATPLLALPLLGAVADLVFQKIRFPRLRVPDAALATGLFLSLIIWPASFSLPIAAVAVATVAARHLLRMGGHPILNPAALGVVLATVVFALPTSWHLGSTVGDAVLVALLGAVLIVKAPHTWRFPAYYFPAYLLVGVNLAFVLGGAGRVVPFLTTGALGAGAIFFAMFMVSEPRTAPSARWAMPIFALLVGAVSAGLPVLFAEVPSIGALGVLSPFLALFAGNGLTVALPSARGATRPSAPAGAGPARAVARGGPSLARATDLSR